MPLEAGSSISSAASEAGPGPPSILGPVLAGTIGYWACQLVANVPVLMSPTPMSAYERFPFNIRLDIVRSIPGVFILYHALGVIGVGTLVLACTRGEPDHSARLGLRAPPWNAGHWILAFTACVGLKLLIIALHIAAIAIRAIPISYLETPVHRSGHVVPELGLAVLAGIAVGCSQELLFRGYIQRGMASRLGPAPAIGWSSLMLAVGQGWPLAPFAFVQSLFLSWLVARAHSIRPAIALHALGTSIALIAFGRRGGYMVWEAHATTGTVITLVVIGVGLFATASRRLNRETAPKPS